jgi:hypothetical protein
LLRKRTWELGWETTTIRISTKWIPKNNFITL